MTTTTNLGITLLEQGQAQKEVTINEALTALDAFVNGSVLDKDLATPPGSPVAGAAYIVAASPTGAWVGHATHIAYFNESWRFVVPQTGARIWVADEGVNYSFNGTSWAIQGAMSGGAIASALASQNLDNVGRVGIGTTDASNKLSVTGNTVLFNSATGDQRTTLNKAASSNNALFVFQDAFSTRAEFGLAGNDDFTMKVSPDGSSFNNGIVIDKTSATVSFPNTPGFAGATASVAGGKGLVPAPAAGDQTKYLKGDGTWATVSGGGSPAGSSGQVQYNSSGAFAAASKVNIQAEGCQALNALAYNASITTPSGSDVTLYARTRANKSVLSYLGADNNPIQLAPHIGFIKYRNSVVIPGAVAPSLMGYSSNTATGTATVRSLSTTNYWTAIPKVSYISAAAVNSGAGLRHSNASTTNYVVRGNAAGIGGFHYIIYAGMNVYQTGCTWFAGLWASTGAVSATAESSALTNVLAMGADSTDTNLQIIYNDASGTASKINLGSSFPANTSATDMYRLILYCKENDTSVYYNVTRMNSGDVADGVLTKDLPVNTTFLNPYINSSTLAGTAAVDIAYAGSYLEG